MLVDFDLAGSPGADAPDMAAELRLLAGTERLIRRADAIAEANGGTLPRDWIARLDAREPLMPKP
jgi:hypothetical protein